MPASRRQVVSPETLAAFGATPLYNARSDVAGRDSATDTTSLSSPVSVEAPITGIKIGRWTIRTQNSSIGDEQAMEDLTVMLEEIANEHHQKTEDDDDDTAGEARSVKRQRRLCPPEITFLNAFISLRLDEDIGQSTSSGDDDNDNTSEIRFTARDALSEWAEAHKSLEMEPPTTDEPDQTVDVPSNQQRRDCRGVSILRTLDAKVWSTKPKTLTDGSLSGGSDSASGAAAAHSSEFYYDWTFSSPYAGSILTSRNNSHEEESRNMNLINNRQEWQPLPQSQIPFHLLQDTSQPILLYDDIHLFEDDLHDNGESSLNIKIRVMPKCWYVLQRLFVRVDYVCVKCREVRYFCLLDNSSTTTAASGSNCRVNTIYRDVTWREASWAELNKRNLPVDPSAWMEHTGSAIISGGGLSATAGALPFPALLTKLPVVSTPDDLPDHSCIILF